MAIALTPFRAFLNFVPPAVLLRNLLAVPELAAIVPQDVVSGLAKATGLSGDSPSLADAQKLEEKKANDEEKKAVKAVFEAIMTAPEDKFKSQLEKLVKRYKDGELHDGEDEKLAKLAVELDGQYPGDIGIFCVYVLNVVDLQPGEAAFLGANMPHAYINGSESTSQSPIPHPSSPPLLSSLAFLSPSDGRFRFHPHLQLCALGNCN